MLFFCHQCLEDILGCILFYLARLAFVSFVQNLLFKLRPWNPFLISISCFTPFFFSGIPFTLILVEFDTPYFRKPTMYFSFLLKGLVCFLSLPLFLFTHMSTMPFHPLILSLLYRLFYLCCVLMFSFKQGKIPCTLKMGMVCCL